MTVISDTGVGSFYSTYPESPSPTSSTTHSGTTVAKPLDDVSGLAFIRRVFTDVFGGGLMEFAEQSWRDYNGGKPLEQIVYELRQTPQYATRFPGMAALRAAGRPVNESTYLDLERTYAQIARQFDLPPGFYDEPSDFGRLIGGEVSPSEWQRRLGDWQAAEREARDPAAAAQIAAQFAAEGLPAPSEGDFLAAFIDPARSVTAIERRLDAARIGTESIRAGYGTLGVDTSLGLADLGVTREQAQQGFGALAESTQIFSGLPGEAGAETFTQGQQIGAAFGTDQASRRRIEEARRRRTAEFSGGGGAGIGRGGLAGLGETG